MLRIDYAAIVKDRKYVSTIDLVRELAKKYRQPLYWIRNDLEAWLPVAFSAGITKERTSSAFLTFREEHCCPKYNGSYISHLTYRNG